MKKCNMCGSQLDDNVMTCPNCGNSNLVSQQVQPSPAYSQPMPQQMPQQVSNYPQGGYQQPMNGVYPQQPMMGGQPVPAQGNMPMTFATVYMILIAIGAASNLVSLFSNFSVGILVSVAFSVATVIFLAKRSKVGRILAMIQGVLEIVGGAFIALAGVLFMVGSGALLEEIEVLATYGSILGVILLVIGAACVAYGVCVFIYFKKRACMYVN